jgi:hypothetical protein
MKPSFVIFPVLLLFFLNSAAQTSSLKESPIEGQFEYVYKNSNDYEEYKVVKRWQLGQLKEHVLDTLTLLKGQLHQKEVMISDKQAAIDSLLILNANVNQALQKTNEEKNSIPFMGIMLQKTVYNSILWSLIGGLAAGLFLFIFLFKRSNRMTVGYKNDLSGLKNEFETFRKRALEREEGVVRKYHDELMKYKIRAGKIKS